ncbi:hypothetical protein ABIE64_002174 [Thalassospira sp. MBR-102]|uniref:Ig-like domain-containing protein n=1 Tax=Thalassospira sp. MBR-102 TaxID=3156466 RepID=UPI0033984475
MSKILYYVAASSTGADFIDLGQKIDGYGNNSQEYVITGSNAVNTLTVAASGTTNAENLYGGEDVIIFSGAWADYEKSYISSKLVLTRTVDGDVETVSVGNGLFGTTRDLLVFSDGAVRTDYVRIAVSNAAGSGSAATTEDLGANWDASTNSTSVTPTDTGSSVLAYVQGSEGGYFAPSTPGMNLVLSGSLYADSIYVTAGSTVDASGLGGGEDVIYLTGAWDDYEKSYVSSKFVLTRTIDGQVETVTVGNGLFGTTRDLLVFADGAVRTDYARIAVSNAAGSGSAASIEDLGANWDPETVTPGLESDTTAPTLTISVDTTDPLQEGDVVTFTFSEIVKDFDISDITVTNGYLEGLVADASGTVYTATFRQEASQSGAVTISVASAAYQDVAGNDGASALLDGTVSGIPALIEYSDLVDGNSLNLSGAPPEGTAAAVLKVLSADGATEMTVIDATYNNETGLWNVAASAAVLAGVGDGNYIFQWEFLDGGNAVIQTVSDATTLELQNSAPEFTGVNVGTILIAQSAAEGTVLLDFSGEDGSTLLFSDSDAEGSINAIFTYSAHLAGGADLPDWIELTSNGTLVIADGMTAPADAGIYEIEITATSAGIDGDPAGAQSSSTIITVSVGEPGMIDSILNGVTNLDVRSDIVLNFTEAAELGTGTITLVNSDTNDTIEIDVSSGNVTLAEDGMSVRISLPDGDMDLGSSYNILIEEGVFITADDATAFGAVVSDEISFSTVTPDAAGAIATTVAGASNTVQAGATWFDGTAGDLGQGTLGLEADLAGISAMIVIGHDTDAGSDIVLQEPSYGAYANFGADDSFYIDVEYGAANNILTTDTVTFVNGENGYSSGMTFSGDNGAAEVLFSLEGDANTAVTGFSTSEAGDTSFESLLGSGAEPVLSG